MMKIATVIACAIAISAAPMTSAETNWQRYSTATNLTAEFPAEPENFVDRWTDRAQGRVIAMNRMMPRQYEEFEAYFFLQAVIADKPYDIERELRDEIAGYEKGGDAGAGISLVSHRALRSDEMPLPGMRGQEITLRLRTFGSDRPQMEYRRSMYVGNKWLSYSVRHFEGDGRWPSERFFRSVGWRP